MPHLLSVSLKHSGDALPAEFPFTVPAVRALREVAFLSPVTFFVGENGSGKSTLLELIAAAVGLPAVGSDATDRDATLAQQRRAARELRVAWRVRTHRGFFLRAEDFFGFAKRVAQLRAEMLARVAEVEEEFRDASAYARGLAMGPARSSLADMQRRYGVDLDANSHGESFLRVFGARLVAGGLYLLDEPEAALSPQSQLAFIRMVAETVAQDGQFIIATHSPILLAYPGATIYSFDRVPLARLQFEELEHVRLTREFLQEPERFLRHLLSDERRGD
jgi:predicted ATPase